MVFILSVIAGLVFGSFANVYFYRIPNNLSLWLPRSFCPQCNQPIAWWNNIPLLSYALLKGKCRFCESDIPWKYPLVEAAGALMFLLVTLRFKNEDSITLTAFLIFSSLLFLAAGIDWVTYIKFDKQYGIIPDHLIWILASIGLLFACFNPVIDGKIRLSLISGFSGGLLMYSFRWAGEKILKKESMGLADVKIIIAVGFWIGWQGVATTLIAGSIIGSLVSLLLIHHAKLDRHSAVPFGPFLAVGALCALFYL